MEDFKDYRTCPKCGWKKNMYGHDVCSSCIGNPRPARRNFAPDTRSEKEVMRDFYENGFQ